MPKRTSIFRLAAAALVCMAAADPSVPDGAKVMSDLEHRAEAGDLAAQSALGTMYFDGQGVPVDTKKALFWNQKAADRNDPAAALRVAFAYGDLNWRFTGNPPFDQKMFDTLRAKAADVAREPASKGNPAALYAIGKIGLRGDFHHDSWDAGSNYYRQAAEAGYAPAEAAWAEAASHVANGPSTRYDPPRNFQAEADWLMKAVLQGSSEGMRRMGEMYGNWSQSSLAQAWLKRAADLNNFEAIQSLCNRFQIKYGNLPDAAYAKGCAGINLPTDYKQPNQSDNSAAKMIAGLLVFGAVLAILSPHSSAGQTANTAGPDQWADEDRRRMEQLNNQREACFWYGQTGDPLMKGFGGGGC